MVRSSVLAQNIVGFRPQDRRPQDLLAGSSAFDFSHFFCSQSNFNVSNLHVSNLYVYVFNPRIAVLEFQKMNKKFEKFKK